MKTTRMRRAEVRDYKKGNVLYTARGVRMRILLEKDIGAWWVISEGERFVIFESHKDMYQVEYN